VGDEGYPLIRRVGIQIIIREDKRGLTQRKEKAIALEEFIRGLPKPLIGERPVLTWISAAGDLMLGRNAGNILLEGGAASLLGGVSAVFAASDLALVNLEGPLSSRGSKASKTFTFRFEPPLTLARALKDAGIGAALFANNHAFDYGADAFLDTLSFLEEAGIGVLGAGRNEEAVLSPVRFKKEGLGIAMWGLASFPREHSGWDGREYAATEEKAGFLHAGKGGADKLKTRFEEESLNIVLFHGGDEWSRRPSQSAAELYSGLARAGADLIIGSHPHIVQGFQWVGEKLIFWSLGNFVFAGMENTGGGDEGLLIRLGYWGKQPVYIEPFALNLSGPTVDIAPEIQLEAFYQKSRELAENP
jgi:poly-gamma-glutamate synthesis protein (capsule biosynthesis protein)